MGERCERSSQAPAMAELAGPLLWDAEEAAKAVRLSYGWSGRESIVALVCDEERRVVMAVEFEGGAPADAATVVDLMALAAPETNSLVIGLCRPRGSLFLDRFEIEAVQEMADRCEKTGTGLLYVIVANEEGWRCVPEFGDPELD